MADMGISNTCLGCGGPLGDGAHQGFCPKCLFSQAIGGTVRVNSPDEEQIGASIGRYKLLEKVGEGGFGAVYVAEQREPVKRRVALKIIKLGMDTKQVVARFEAERQALALMEHPNIAKVLDGGATETGRPYFVMELVRGQRITDYCDQNNLPTEQRLGLFMQVCHAIQHAHQKGIIHRDIKPSNILVTVLDGQPIPKVIDFGVAKATQGQLTEKTVYTELHQFIGTPAYISPEQAALSAVDVDTRSDIYSLGVLLYELLTGHTPFDAKTLLEAGLDEVRRMIREQEPPRPSTRISALDAAERTTVAKHRQAEPAALSRSVRGDLDWIVMKCLEKERGRRYETANNLAQDIEHHLKHEPVTAAAPSALYRAGKFVRRHKGGLATATALVLLLASGAVVSTWQAIRATRAKATAIAEKQRADREAAIANRINQYVQEVLYYSVTPDSSKDLGYSLRQVMDGLSDKLGSGASDPPEVQAALHGFIGNLYRGLQYNRSEHHLSRALELRRARFGAQHERYADSLVDYAVLISQNPDGFAEAETSLRQALAIYRARQIEGHPVIRALWALEFILDNQRKWSEVEPVAQEALAEAKRSPSLQYWELGPISRVLIKARIAEGRFAEAESAARETVDTAKRLYGPEHVQTARAQTLLASALLPQRKFKEALAAATQSLASMRKRVAPTNDFFGYAFSTVLETLTAARSAHALAGLFPSPDQLSELESPLRQMFLAEPRTPGSKFDPLDAAARGLVQFPALYAELGGELSAAGQTQEAQQCQQKAGALLTNLVTELARDLKHASALARSFQASGATAEARAVYVSLLARLRQQLGDTHPELGAALCEFADFLKLDVNDPSAAAEQYLQALRIQRAGQNADLARMLRQLGDALLRAGKPKDAEPYCREGIEVYRKVHPGDDPTTAWVQHLLAQALNAQGKFPEAEALLRQALKTYLEHLGGDANELPGLISDLASVLTSQGKNSEAEGLWREVSAMRRKRLGRDHPDVLAAMAEVAVSLHAQNKLPERDAVLSELEAIFPAALAQYQGFATNRSRHPECWRFAISYERFGQTLRQIGRTQQAEKAYRDAQTLWIKLVSSSNLVDDRWHLAINQDALGGLLQDAGRPAEAVEAYRSALAIWEKLAAETQVEDHRNHRFWTSRALADLLRQQGKLAEAEAIYRELAEHGQAAQLNDLAWQMATSADPKAGNEQAARRLAEQAVALTSRTNAMYLDTLAAAYAASGQFTNAVKVQNEAIALLQNERDKKDYASRLRLYESGAAYRDHAALATQTRDLLAAGKFTEAEPLARECVVLRERLMPDDWRTFNARSMLGASLLGQKKYAEAEPLLLSGYRGMKERRDQMPEAGLPRLPEALDRLTELYTAVGRPEEIREFTAAKAAEKRPASQSATAAVSPARLRDSLVLHFTFDQEWTDGKVPDASGKGNHGRVFGAKWEPAGRRGGAARFTPPNQFIVVSNSASLNPPQLTVAAWIKTSRQDDVWRRVVDKNYATGFALSIGGMVGANSRFRGRATMEIGMDLNKQQGIDTSAVIVTDGDWHHVASTYDGTSQLLYVDGIRQSRGVRWQGEVPANAHDLTIGMNLINPEPPESRNSFDGLIDEVMLFNRALSLEEIQALLQEQP